MARVLVLGAGIAGLVGARVLETAGHEVVVLDKGHRPGGRMATKRPDGPRGPVFDTGAQFVTLRSEELATETARWRDEGWLVEWFRGSPDLGAESDGDGHPRFRGAPFQRGLAAALADELADVRCGVRVTALRHEAGWVAATDDGDVRADALLATPPAPQLLDLLADGHTTLPDPLDQTLRTVTYDPCIAVLAVPTGGVDLPGTGIVRLPDHDVLDVVVDNRAKGVSRRPALTLHATADWSRSHWDDPDDVVGPALVAMARDLLGTSAEVRHVHRWRYSSPTSSSDDLAPGALLPGPVRVAGDAFAGGRVEGAALSGWTAAQRLLDDLTAAGTAP